MNRITNREALIHPFPPLYDADSRVLILGSFPSRISRRNNFYYGNPQNRFWKLMEQLYDETISDRTAFCHRHHIALWDVIESCTIMGSSDSSIRDVVVNDIPGLIKETGITAVFTTGRKAFDLYRKYITSDVPMYPLPSTSGANAAMKMNDLLEHYRIIREVTDEQN